MGPPPAEWQARLYLAARERGPVSLEHSAQKALCLQKDYDIIYWYEINQEEPSFKIGKDYCN